MLITEVDLNHTREWLSLAKELEPIFKAPMADNDEFQEFVNNRIKMHEALAALDRRSENIVVV